MVESMCLPRWWKPGMVLVNAFVIQLVKGTNCIGSGYYGKPLRLIDRFSH